MGDSDTGGPYRDAMCPDCGSILTGSREPGDRDTCRETGEEVVLAEANLENRLDRLDAITLEDHPMEARIEVRALLPGGHSPEMWEDHLEWYAKTEFSDLAAVVEVEVTNRDPDTGDSGEGG